MSACGSKMQCSPSKFILYVKICILLNKFFDYSCVSSLGSMVQRRFRLGIQCVDIGALL